METRFLESVESVLEREIGLSAKSLGPGSVARSVMRRMAVRGCPSPGSYLLLVTSDPGELQDLVESVVVPETWFFRNRPAFDYLARLVREKRAGTFRVLSIPCASGEEPLSVVMAVKDAGLSPERVAVDALDVSREILARAREGIYTVGSFRGSDLAYRDRHFVKEGEGFRAREEIARRVTYFQGNLFDCEPVTARGPYEAILCRNLLIYLSPEARRRAVEILDQVLAPGGHLFVGHAERPAAGLETYEWIREPGVFAGRKPAPGRDAPKGRPAARLLPAPAPPAALKTPAARPPLEKVRPEARETVPAPVAPQAPAPEASLLETARGLADRGDLENGRRTCAEHLDKNPGDPEGHFLLGILCQAMGDEREAFRSFGRTLYLDPWHLEAMNCMAFLLEGRGEHGKALRMRERAKRAMP